ncbi:GL20662 [Drosophila persimilis]|uniref:GL20662 n=1 Tax=Drosophila persimilis TaxID=7234 RepID=B4HDJ5_DROPE|nr:GL20662 [Drosophila persimilis]
MVHFERDIGDSANVSAKQQKRDRYEEAGDEQHIGTTVMVKGGRKQGRGHNDGGGDGKCNSVGQFEQDIGKVGAGDGKQNSMEQIKQPIKKTAMVKAGHKQRRARNDGGGDGQFNSVEQLEQHIVPTVMIKDGQKQEQDRNDGGGDGKRSKQLRHLQILTSIAAERRCCILYPFPMEIMTPFMDEGGGGGGRARGDTGDPGGKRRESILTNFFFGSKSEADSNVNSTAVPKADVAPKEAEL